MLPSLDEEAANSRIQFTILFKPKRRTSIQVMLRRSVGRIPALVSKYLSKKVNGSNCMIIIPLFVEKININFVPSRSVYPYVSFLLICIFS